jgi:hypothetical protein
LPTGRTSIKATALYRIASALLFVAAVGNTFGVLRFWQVAGAIAPVPFPIGHASFSYAQIVLGYQLFCSLCILFAAYLAWHLGAVARTTPYAIGALGWVLFAYQLLGVCVSWILFAGFVRLLALAIAICLGWAAGLTTVRRSAQQRESERAPA